MLLLLRRIRYGHWMKGSVSRYLGYALGEVVLVVAGILIALQVDAWQRERDDRELERQYLLGLAIDLQDDIGRVDIWIERFDQKIAGLDTAKQFFYGEIDVENDKEVLRKISFGGISSRGQFLLESPTFEDLVSTGNLALFKDRAFKRELGLYFANKAFLQAYSANLRSDFANYVNSTYPWNARDPEGIDVRDAARVAERFRAPGFLDLVNLELTFAYSTDRAIRRHRITANALLTRIETRLAELGSDDPE